MSIYEIGILPQSSVFSFSPNAQTQKNYYHMIWCGHLFCNEDYYIKRKYYAPLLLIYVRSGSFHLELEQQSYVATAGQVVFLDCRQAHYYYVSEKSDFYYIHFDGPQAHEICHTINKLSGVVIDSPENAEIFSEMKSLLHFYEKGMNESVIASSYRLYRFFLLLDNPNHTPQLQKNDESLNLAIKYIRSNVGKKITLQDLAELSDLCVYYFSHLFKSLTGQSPIEFIVNSRIDQAKVLLTNTNYSIAEISKRVGYPNSSNLITLFTERVGTSPLQFRNQSRPSSPNGRRDLT